jgi:hypothetical protein
VLSVTHGTLSVTRGGSGLSSNDVDYSNGNATVTITGTLAEINAVLKGTSGAALSYDTTSDNPPATATLSVKITDDGTGLGGALSHTATSTINIAPSTTRRASTAARRSASRKTARPTPRSARSTPPIRTRPSPTR